MSLVRPNLSNIAKTTIGLAIIAIIALTPLSALAAITTPSTVTNPLPSAKITFTFDDGLASTYTQARPALAANGLTGTTYVTTGCIGMTTANNTCRANDSTPYMSWTQVKALQTAGWEIGSHTVTHPYLATSDASDGQPNVLTPAQVTTELTKSKADLAAQGINATAFASPYGDYNGAVLAQVAKYYTSQRGFADQNNNDWPYNDYIINDFHVENPITVAQVKAKIDDAVANKRWLVLTFHDIKTRPSTNPDDYEWSTANLKSVAAYAKTKINAGLLANTNISKGQLTSSTNLLPNASFNNGVADGWTTNNPSLVRSDAASNGSYPDPTNSIRIQSPASGGAYLFSPKIAVNSSNTYAFKNYVYMQSFGSGEISFYADEYDVNGNWISGKYLGGDRRAFAENYNYAYKPTSPAVASVSLQIGATGSGINAYVDNVQLFAVQVDTTPPPVTPNLINNGDFESGFTGWSTDSSASIALDTAGNGSPNNATNSAKLTSTTSNKHLFSPKVTADSTKSYTVNSYLNLKTITGGEVGFYIDEYDAAGNWISGQYKTGIRAVRNGDVTMAYTPSSANVKSASLQIIVVGNSGISAYFDDVRWRQN